MAESAEMRQRRNSSPRWFRQFSNSQFVPQRFASQFSRVIDIVAGDGGNSNYEFNVTTSSVPEKSAEEPVPKSHEKFDGDKGCDGVKPDRRHTVCTLAGLDDVMPTLQSDKANNEPPRRSRNKSHVSFDLFSHQAGSESEGTKTKNFTRKGTNDTPIRGGSTEVKPCISRSTLEFEHATATADGQQTQSNATRCSQQTSSTERLPPTDAINARDDVIPAQGQISPVTSSRRKSESAFTSTRSRLLNVNTTTAPNRRRVSVACTPINELPPCPPSTPDWLIDIKQAFKSAAKSNNTVDSVSGDASRGRSGSRTSICDVTESDLCQLTAWCETERAESSWYSDDVTEVEQEVNPTVISNGAIAWSASQSAAVGSAPSVQRRTVESVIYNPNFVDDDVIRQFTDGVVESKYNPGILNGVGVEMDGSSTGHKPDFILTSHSRASMESSGMNTNVTCVSDKRDVTDTQTKMNVVSSDLEIRSGGSVPYMIPSVSITVPEGEICGGGRTTTSMSNDDVTLDIERSECKDGGGATAEDADDDNSGSTEGCDGEWDLWNEPEDSLDDESDLDPLVPLASMSRRFSERTSSHDLSVITSPTLATNPLTIDRSRECMVFMADLVQKIFDPTTDILPGEKLRFHELCQLSAGRLWFVRCLDRQQLPCTRQVQDVTFYRLIQYCTLALYECDQTDDHVTARAIMNLSFAFSYDSRPRLQRHLISNTGPWCTADGAEVLYGHIKNHVIWSSLRFWTAAYFDAVQQERAVAIEAVHCNSREKMETSRKQIADETNSVEHLNMFTMNMRTLGLSKSLCLEFVRKQAVVSNLSEDQLELLKENIEKSPDKDSMPIVGLL